MIKPLFKQSSHLFNSLSYRVLTLAQSNLHPILRESQELRYRARMLVMLTYFFIAFLFSFMLLMMILPLPHSVKMIIAMLWVFQISAHSVVAYLLQVRGSYSIAAHLMLVSLSALYFVDITITGGPVRSALTDVFYLIPILAYFLLGMRGGTVWTVGLLCTLILIFALAFLEVPFIDVVPNELRHLISAFCFFSGFLFVFFMILIYENTFLGLQSQQKKSESQTRYLATHDQLTGIANRTRFYHVLDQSIANFQEKQDRCFAFLYMDLVGFKEINDMYGHHAGDLVLQKIANRLDQGVRDTDLVARHGGDEFVFILNKVKGDEALKSVANKIAAMVSEPIMLIDLKLQVFPSMGIAVFPDHARDSTTLERLADSAMYQAKTKKCDWQIYQGADSRNFNDKK